MACELKDREPPMGCTDPNVGALYWRHAHNLKEVSDDALRHVTSECPACAQRLIEEAVSALPTELTASRPGTCIAAASLSLSPPPGCLDTDGSAALFWSNVGNLGAIECTQRVLALRHVATCPACAIQLAALEDRSSASG